MCQKKSTEAVQTHQNTKRPQIIYLEHNTDQQHQESKARIGFTLFIFHHSYPQILQVTKDRYFHRAKFKLTSYFRFYKFNLLSKYSQGTANLSRLIQYAQKSYTILSFRRPIFTHHFLAQSTKPINTFKSQKSINRALEHLLNNPQFKLMLLNGQL